MVIVRSAWFIVAAVGLAACAQTQVRVTAFKDPDFQSASYARFLVAAPNLLPENALYFEEEMCAALQPSACMGASALFPPTRTYTTDDLVAIIKKSGAQAVLVLSLESDQSASRYVGTYATANATSNASSTYGTALAIPIVRTDRGARAAVLLKDVASWRNAWAGDVAAAGRGYGASNAALISGAAYEIAEELRRVGLVAPPAEVR